MILVPAVSFNAQPNLALTALVMGAGSTQNSLTGAVDG